MNVMPTTSAVETSKTPAPRAYVWLTAALLVYISWEALRPEPAGSGLQHLDKLLHFSAFATLALPSALALAPSRRNTWAVAAALLLYGALIEIVQTYVPGRDASWWDLLADAAGIATGLLLVGALRQLPVLQRR